MKKIISIFLAFIIMLSSLSVGVNAIADELQYILLNEPVMFESSNNKKDSVYFTVSEDGYYEINGVFEGTNLDNIYVYTMRDGKNYFPGRYLYNSEKYAGTVLANDNYFALYLAGGYTYCFQCQPSSYNNKYGDSYGIVVKEHKHSLMENRTEPNCSKRGSLYYNCKRCSYVSDTEYFPINDDHNYVYGVCSRCNKRDLSYTEFRDYQINAGDSVTFDVKKQERAFFHFTPSEDSWYRVTTKTYSGRSATVSVYENGQKVNLSSNGYIGMKAGCEYVIDIYSYYDDDSITLNFEEHQHKLKEQSKTYPNCTYDGKTVMQCSVCYYSYNEISPANGEHLYVNGACKICQKIDETYEKLVREMKLDEVYPLHTVYGGEKLYFTFDADESDIYDIVITCASSAKKSYSLKIYDDNGNSYANLGWGVQGTDTKAFQLEKGNRVNIEFTGCNEYDIDFSIIIRHHIHDYEKSTYKATCDSIGYTEYTCKISPCTYSYIGDRVEATGAHKLSTETVAPTCIEPGYTACYCDNCDFMYLYNYVSQNPNAHSYSCGVCEDCGAKKSTFNPTELTLGEQLDVIHKSNTGSFISITPTSSGWYTIKSLAPSSIDPYAELYSENMQYITEEDDISNSNYNFSLTAYFVAGQQYYLYVDIYETVSTTFSLDSFEHKHSFGSRTVSATCGEKGYTNYSCYCGEVYYADITPATEEHRWKTIETVAPNCTNDGYTLQECSKCSAFNYINPVPKNGEHFYFNGFCELCGEEEPTSAEIRKDIQLGTTDVRITQKNQIAILKFIPDETGDYLFETKGVYDTFGYIYDKYEHPILKDDDSGLGDNCCISAYLVSGETYYFAFRVLDSDAADVKAVVLKHSHSFVAFNTEPTCFEEGSTTYTCKTCLYEYETDFEPATYNHNFKSGICVECGEFDPNAEFNELNQAGKTELGEDGVLTFVANSSCKYQIKSVGNYEVAAVLVDEFYNIIATVESNSKDDFNFVIEENLVEGLRYYLAVVASTANPITISAKICHDYEETVTPPTCLKDGCSELTCKNCGVKIIGDAISKTGHNLETKTTLATTSKNGSIVTTCKNEGCSYKTTKTIYYPKSVTLSASSYTYDGNLKKPTVKAVDANGKTVSNSNYTVTYSNNKSVGTATVKVKFKGNYSGELTKTFKINPKNTSGLTLSARSKGFTAKWKKYTTQTTGYQIQYSTNSSFENAKTVTISKNTTISKSVTKLSAKKKYYVRIRTYKTVNGTKHYSTWSSAKSVKTK